MLYVVLSLASCFAISCASTTYTGSGSRSYPTHGGHAAPGQEDRVDRNSTAPSSGRKLGGGDLLRGLDVAYKSLGIAYFIKALGR